MCPCKDNPGAVQSPPHPGQQQQAAPQGPAVAHHGHDDQEAADSDDDRVDGRGVGRDGRLLQPGGGQTASGLGGNAQEGGVTSHAGLTCNVKVAGSIPQLLLAKVSRCP